jgi:stage V sporulation protein AE
MDWMMSLLRAFAVGGLFCVLAQILIDKTGLTPARDNIFYYSLGKTMESAKID